MAIIHKQTSNIRKDPKIKSLIARLPDEIKYSFNDEQLEALKIVLGDNDWKTHPIDIRTTFGLFGKRYYLVFIAGKSHRRPGRIKKMIMRKAEVLFVTFFVMFLILVGLVFLYLLKSAMGIDIMDGQSLGLWDWINQIIN